MVTSEAEGIRRVPHQASLINVEQFSQIDPCLDDLAETVTMLQSLIESDRDSDTGQDDAAPRRSVRIKADDAELDNIQLLRRLDDELKHVELSTSGTSRHYLHLTFTTGGRCSIGYWKDDTEAAQVAANIRSLLERRKSWIRSKKPTRLMFGVIGINLALGALMITASLNDKPGYPYLAGLQWALNLVIGWISVTTLLEGRKPTISPYNRRELVERRIAFRNTTAIIGVSVLLGIAGLAATFAH